VINPILAAIALVTSAPAAPDAGSMIVQLECEGNRRGTGTRLSDETVVTANHVLRTACSVAGVPVEVVRTYEDLDLAVLRVPAPQSGHWFQTCSGAGFFEPYQAFGYAKGQLRVVNLTSTGLRSKSGTIFEGTDTTIGGMSGGPVLDYLGRVAGIVLAHEIDGTRSMVRMFSDTPLCQGY